MCDGILRILLSYMVSISWETADWSSIPLCKQCHFLRYNTWNETVCSLYGRLNVLDGSIHYDHCQTVRGNEKKCGEDGRLFVRAIPFRSASGESAKEIVNNEKKNH